MKLRIQELCSARGMTQKELAARLEVHEITISRATKGSASLELVERIANELGVDVGELFEGKFQTIVCPHCGKKFRIVSED